MTDTKQNNDITFNFLDAPTGVGKTTAIINKVNEEATLTNTRFIVVTPYLDEIDRICSSTPCIDPKRSPKEQDLQKLIQDGKNICCSHSLFSKLNKKTFNMFKDSLYRYSLIIDEEIETIKVSGFNKEYGVDKDYMDVMEKYSIEDINLLKEQDLINSDPHDGHLKWNDQKDYSTGVFRDLKELLKTTDIYIQGNSLIQLPKNENFSVFQEITVCSYRMKYGLLYAYCRFNNIRINWQHIEAFNIVDGYKDTKPSKLNMLHTYCPPKKEFKCSGSVHWYRTQQNDSKSEAFKYLRSSFRNFKENRVPKGYHKDYYWTTYMSFLSCFTKDKNICKKNHVACNLKATNSLSSCNLVGYFIQRHIHPDIYNFLHNKGIVLDKENYALSEAIQFIWRSNIRTDSDRDVYVFFASQKLKTIFDYWKDN